MQNAFPQSEILPEGKSQIELNNGKVIHATKLWRVHGLRLEYELDGGLHDVNLEKIKIIKPNNEVYEIVNYNLHKTSSSVNLEQENVLEPSLLVVSAPAKIKIEPDTSMSALVIHDLDSGAYFYNLGKQDGKKYYDSTGAFIGSMTLYAAPILAVIPPNNPGKNNIHASLYYSNKKYHDGYRKAAHCKKALNVLVGFLTTVAVGLAMAAAAGE